MRDQPAAGGHWQRGRHRHHRGGGAPGRRHGCRPCRVQALILAELPPAFRVLLAVRRAVAAVPCDAVSGRWQAPIVVAALRVPWPGQPLHRLRLRWLLTQRDWEQRPLRTRNSRAKRSGFAERRGCSGAFLARRGLGDKICSQRERSVVRVHREAGCGGNAIALPCSYLLTDWEQTDVCAARSRLVLDRPLPDDGA